MLVAGPVVEVVSGEVAALDAPSVLSLLAFSELVVVGVAVCAVAKAAKAMTMMCFDTIV